MIRKMSCEFKRINPNQQVVGFYNFNFYLHVCTPGPFGLGVEAPTATSTSRVRDLLVWIFSAAFQAVYIFSLFGSTVDSD
jgi:hypothetical protein